MKKKNIYYARTYRHLNINKVKAILTTLLFIIPSIIAFVMNIDDITYFFSDRAADVLGKTMVGAPIYIEQSEFSILSQMNYVAFPTTYPQISFIIANLIIVIVLLLFLNSGKRSGKPVAIYFTLGSVTHLINCIYPELFMTV